MSGLQKTPEPMPSAERDTVVSAHDKTVDAELASVIRDGHRALVVCLEPGLATFRVVGLVHAIVTTLPGVQSVVAIESISAETLLAMLLKPVEEPRAPIEPRQADLFGEGVG